MRTVTWRARVPPSLYSYPYGSSILTAQPSKLKKRDLTAVRNSGMNSAWNSLIPTNMSPDSWIDTREGGRDDTTSTKGH